MGRFEENDIRVLFVDGNIAHTHFRHVLAFADESTLHRNLVVAFDKPRQVSRWFDLFNRVEIGIGNAGHSPVTQVKNQVLSRFDGARECDAVLFGNDAGIAYAALAFDSEDQGKRAVVMAPPVPLALHAAPIFAGVAAREGGFADILPRDLLLK